MYVDQFPPGDLSRALSHQNGFPIVPKIREAILGASGKADVGSTFHGQARDEMYS